MEFNLTAYLWCAAGIVVSVMLPIAWAYVRKWFPAAQPAGLGSALGSIWDKVVKRYLVLALAALATALLLVFFLGDKIDGEGTAFLAGYAWQATLEKIGKPTAA